ncbi:hypothetical protein CR161_11610 [Prosthecochloris sp. ZM]|uniref:Uncharacterized protein n=1 Tax=Prosthecochloris aestuarii (strain DSM 271 / SK 413) TaxID=290512 RepID=B4S6T2_PROA2|nr:MULTISPECIES: hypothetical protein [Prosthecochloris]ACF47287.1 hypothetical protein Paes_2286 [Prosthecochloris aestuarii DSM 271]NEX12821.1 hypothetical protein [Prosthecochloris sp.]RDD31290.1 hypothetical protein CR161_11610 [Prosthecochloris sp. ZM]
MYQLKIRNAEQSDDFRVLDLTEEQWLHWKDVLVSTGVCRPEHFESDNKRLVISYYPGTFPEEIDDQEIMDLL